MADIYVACSGWEDEQSQHVGHRKRQEMGDSPLFVDRIDVHLRFVQLDRLHLYRPSGQAMEVDALGSPLLGAFCRCASSR